MSNWFDACWDEEDEVTDDELLLEFEKLLNGEDNDYEALSKDVVHRPDTCYHAWEKAGQSMYMKDDEYWYNCKKCSMKKEVYEKEKMQKM